MHRFSYLRATNIFIQRERQYSIARFVILPKPLLNEAGNTPMGFTSFIILSVVQFQSSIFRCTLWPIIIHLEGGGAQRGDGNYVVTLKRRVRLFVLSFHSFHSKLMNFCFLFFFEKLWRKPP